MPEVIVGAGEDPAVKSHPAIMQASEVVMDADMTDPAGR